MSLDLLIEKAKVISEILNSLGERLQKEYYQEAMNPTEKSNPIKAAVNYTKVKNDKYAILVINDKNPEVYVVKLYIVKTPYHINSIEGIKLEAINQNGKTLIYLRPWEIEFYNDKTKKLLEESGKNEVIYLEPANVFKTRRLSWGSFDRIKLLTDAKSVKVNGIKYNSPEELIKALKEILEG